MKGLPDIFYTHPETADMIMDRKDLKELLLSMGGCMITKGNLWNIKAKHLAAGVYRVTIERKKYKGL